MTESLQRMQLAGERTSLHKAAFRSRSLQFCGDGYIRRVRRAINAVDELMGNSVRMWTRAISTGDFAA